MRRKASLYQRVLWAASRACPPLVGGVNVEAAVRLAERPQVSGHVLLPEEAVEPDQVVVSVALGDRPRADQLVAVAAVGGGEVQHRSRPRLLRGFDRSGKSEPQVRKLSISAGCLSRLLAELAEVGRVAGVADAEEDLLALGQQGARLGAGGGRQAGQSEEDDYCDSRTHPGRFDRGWAITFRQPRPRRWLPWLTWVTSCSTSSAYLATKLGPMPRIAARLCCSLGRPAAIAARVELWATV